MDIKQLPAATTLGEALRRMGKFSSIRDCLGKGESYTPSIRLTPMQEDDAGY